MDERLIKRVLCHAGYTEPVYELYRDEIAAQNRSMVQSASFIGGVIMLALTFAALLVKSIAAVLPLYLGMAMIFCFIYAVVRFGKPNSSAVILLLNYSFLSAAFFFSLGLDVIQKNPTATTVCVLLVVLPLLIVDKPYREFLFFLAASLCFMLESVYLKRSPKASVDVLNAVSFLVMGCFLGYKHNQMVLRSLSSQRLLEVQRDTDALTNLYNKNAFENLVQQYLQQGNGTGSILVIDMDNFKHVNDTYGHQTGDELLAKVGAILSSQFRKGDYVCRFGGDEFTAFLPGVADKALLRRKAEGVLAHIERLRLTADEAYRAQLCMGIAAYPADGKSYDELFRNADNALYRVKQNGKNGFAFYDESLRKKLLVVDDIEMDRAILKKILGTEYDILEAADGGAALKLLEADPDITMVITDIQMPGMDGAELIRRIRSDSRYAQVAVIADTQFGDTKQEAEIISLGADDFVYKAASPGVIQNRVHNVMRAMGR